MPYLEAAQLPPGGLRLHHLHRQQRPAARARGRSRPEGKPGGGRRAQRQPQLRRPHQPAGQGQLPGLAAAGGGLRAGRHRGHRSAPTSRWAQDPTASRSTCATSGPPTKKCSDAVRDSVNPGMFQHEYAHAFDGDAQLADHARAHRRHLRVGRALHLHQEAALFRPHGGSRQRPSTDLHGMRVLALLGDSVTTDHISPAGSIPKDSPAGHYLIAQGVAARGLQLLRRAPRQSRSDGARHAGQHPPAQPAGARHRRRLDASTCRTASRCPSTTPPCSTRRKACR